MRHLAGYSQQNIDWAPHTLHMNKILGCLGGKDEKSIPLATIDIPINKNESNYKRATRATVSDSVLYIIPQHDSIY